MRMIKIDDYNPETMQLAEPIYDQKRRILLAAGRSINIKILERIKNMEISHILVEDYQSKGITLDEMLDMPTWIDIIALVEKAYIEGKMLNSKTVRLLQQSAEKLIEEIQRRSVLMLIPSTSVTDEQRLYAHAVNVTLLALQTSKSLSYTKSKMKDLAIGCLLHDIGKVISIGDEHTNQGFDILRKHPEINLLSAHVAFQHHETLAGEGFPRKIKGEEFHEFGQLGGIANLYENMISLEKRPPHEVIEYLMAQSDLKFSQKIITAFVNSVPSYFPGTRILINNGEEAIVTKIDTMIHRPVVRLISNNGELTLVDHPTLLVENVL